MTPQLYGHGQKNKNLWHAFFSEDKIDGGHKTAWCGWWLYGDLVELPEEASVCGNCTKAMGKEARKAIKEAHAAEWDRRKVEAATRKREQNELFAHKVIGLLKTTDFDTMARARQMLEKAPKKLRESVLAQYAKG